MLSGKTSQAREFLEHLKSHPADRNDVSVWKKFKVQSVVHEWNNQGYYKTVSFDFADGSLLDNNKVYD